MSTMDCNEFLGTYRVNGSKARSVRRGARDHLRELRANCRGLAEDLGTIRLAGAHSPAKRDAEPSPARLDWPFVPSWSRKA